MKNNNGTGGSRETSRGKLERVEEPGRESINFFAELQWRNVYKVAVAYIVAGWALLQGITQVFPVFDVPNWVIRLVVVLIIVGCRSRLLRGGPERARKVRGIEQLLGCKLRAFHVFLSV